MNARLFPFAGECADGFGVGNRVGDMPGHRVRCGLANVDQPCPPADERQHQHQGRGEHRQQRRDESGRVRPQHRDDERHRDKVGGHLKAHDVEDILEPPRVAERALGQ